MAKKSTALDLGPMPVAVVNKTLELDLEPGPVVFSEAAQKHAAKHKEFADCLPHVARIVAAPLYLGDDFRNAGKIEMIGRAKLNDEIVGILVAVTIEKDAAGNYNVTSLYPISQKKVEDRRKKGHLRVALKR